MPMTLDPLSSSPGRAHSGLVGGGDASREPRPAEEWSTWTEAQRERLESAFEENFDLVWRTLRGLGVGVGAADDAAQQVYCVFARRMDSIEVTKERAFLVQTAVRVASNCRRTVIRQRETSGDVLDHQGASEEDPEKLLVQKQRYELLERLLDTLPSELRTIFVLFELEGQSSPEIAGLLGLPRGTVVSRLRRARAMFSEAMAELQQHLQPGGHP